jgi:integrase/recombinase XerD
MKCIISDQVVFLRPPQGPLALYIASFSTWASALGYALYSLRRRVRIAVDFSRWLAEKSIRLSSVSSRHAAQYLRYRARRQRIREGDATALRQLLDFLHQQGVIPAEKIRRLPLSPIDRSAQAFERYLREERVLAKATIVNYVPFIRHFLKDRFGGGPVRLSRLCAGDVVRFVQRRASRLHLKTAKLLTTALRSFLQYGAIAVISSWIWLPPSHVW